MDAENLATEDTEGTEALLTGATLDELLAGWMRATDCDEMLGFGDIVAKPRGEWCVMLSVNHNLSDDASEKLVTFLVNAPARIAELEAELPKGEPFYFGDIECPGCAAGLPRRSDDLLCRYHVTKHSHDHFRGYCLRDMAARYEAAFNELKKLEAVASAPEGEDERMPGKARMALERDLESRPARGERGPDATKYESALSVIEALRRVLEQAELESAEARTELTLQEAKLAKAGAELTEMRVERAQLALGLAVLVENGHKVGCRCNAFAPDAECECGLTAAKKLLSEVTP